LIGDKKFTDVEMFVVVTGATITQRTETLLDDPGAAWGRIPRRVAGFVIKTICNNFPAVSCVYGGFKLPKLSR
jgi:hypothetical protein